MIHKNRKSEIADQVIQVIRPGRNIFWILDKAVLLHLYQHRDVIQVYFSRKDQPQCVSPTLVHSAPEKIMHPDQPVQVYNIFLDM